MKKVTEREIKRLLAARGTPEPPPGLAERIQAEIPDVLQVGSAGLTPDGVRGMPPRSPALRPLWLLAASLLVVIGAGFVAVRFFAPTSDLARDIALGGVVRIEDIVVTVPERSTVERQNAVMASQTTKRLRKGQPPAPDGAGAATAPKPAPARGMTLRGYARQTAGAGAAGIPLEPEAAATGNEAGSSHAEKAVVLDARKSEHATAGVRGDEGGVEARRIAADRSAQAPSRSQAAKGSIVVGVHDPDGRPVAGATVLLAFSGRPDVGCGFRVTGAAGVVTFCCVAPGTYRICAQLPGFTAASQKGIVVPSGRQLTVELSMERRPADGTDHPWTCPTPRPAGKP